MTGITGRVFPFTDCDDSEAEGIRVIQGLALFSRPFSVIAENYGYQVTTFAALIISGPCFSRPDKALEMTYKVVVLSYI